MCIRDRGSAVMSPRNQMASPEAPTITVPPARVIHPQRSRRRGLIVVGVGVVLLLMVRGLLVQAFYIPSGSMEPTLAPGDRILVNKVGVASSVKPVSYTHLRAHETVL